MVGYRNHCDPLHERYEIFSFSGEADSAGAFHTFLSHITAKGGGDPSEDVAGGLQVSVVSTSVSAAHKMLWEHRAGAAQIHRSVVLTFGSS